MSDLYTKLTPTIPERALLADLDELNAHVGPDNKFTVETGLGYTLIREGFLSYQLGNTAKEAIVKLSAFTEGYRTALKDAPEEAAANDAVEQYEHIIIDLLHEWKTGEGNLGEHLSVLAEDILERRGEDFGGVENF